MEKNVSGFFSEHSVFSSKIVCFPLLCLTPSSEGTRIDINVIYTHSA